jgi:acetyl esterase/lipase
MKTFVVLFCIFMFFEIKTIAQQTTIPLYQKTVPGWTGVNLTEISEKGNDGITRVWQVTHPEITVYKPLVKTTDASVIICPGGGYGILAIDHEGYEIAEWFNQRGMTAFVLKYRLPLDTLFTEKYIRPLQDVQQAFRIIRTHATEYGISADKIGIMGFSAGGHLAATASTHFETQVGEITDNDVSVRPDFSILIYPVITFSPVNTHSGSRDNLLGYNAPDALINQYSNELHVTSDTPPTFLISTTDDGVSPENSILYFQACRNKHVPVEMHIYEKGGHGYSLKKNGLGPVESWPFRLEDWLRERKLIR